MFYEHPIYRSLDNLFWFFVPLFFFLAFTCPFTTNGPPPLHFRLAGCVHNIPIPSPFVCQSLPLMHPPFLPSYRSHSFPFYHIFPNRHSNNFSFRFLILLLLAGDIELNPGPTLSFAHLNTCSVSSITSSIDKPALLQEFIGDQSLDILTLSETWLPPDVLPSVLNSLTPPYFSILSSPRLTGKGGGLAVIYRSFLHISKVDLPLFSSFESLCFKLTIASSSFIFLTIYRPPSSSAYSFVSDFSILLDDLISSPSELIISGDFNLHVDSPSSPPVASFLASLTTLHLQQHVTFPTHIHSHTLDLLISRTTSNVVTSVAWIYPFISDHYAVLADLIIPTSARASPIIRLTRSIRTINVSAFSTDILNSPLYSVKPSTLEAFVALFNSTLLSLLDKHAPLKSTSFAPRCQKPYITPSIRAAKKIRSKLETIYRRTRSLSDLTLFKNQCRALSKLISSSKRLYYRSLISSHQNQPRQLWAAINSLLSRNIPTVLPASSSFSTLASSFLKFFDDKIAKLCLSSGPGFASTSAGLASPPIPPPSLQSFHPATLEEVRHAIISANDSSSVLDIIPTPLLKSLLPVLLQPITDLINLSLSGGLFPSTFKHALVKPLLKKHNLPPQDLSSYRPISNLNFISKIIERIIHTRLTNHLNSFKSLSSFQSAYRKFHSTETALLKIQNDLLLASNQQKVSALILLDLSAAFDTIDHRTLFTRLSTFFGITGSALKLIESYLCDRTQSVVIGDTTTPPSPLRTGVPQGSVLGPLLFSMYTSPISHIFDNSPISHHLYADDTQLYMSFSAADSANSLSLLSSTLDSVHSWFTASGLTVNPAKTEYLLIGTPQQRAKVTSTSIQFQSIALNPTLSARNLGVVFESDHSFKKHISTVCQVSFFHIRTLRQIRPSLDLNSAILLANSLVSSRLDFCNSLLYGLPASSLHRLQRVQNALARTVMPSANRRDHCSPILHKLHWLPVNLRILFKIGTLTFNILHHDQPSYLSNLLTRYYPSRSLRSSTQNLLVVPRINTEMGRRSFKFAAPTVWNSLPDSIRSCSSLLSFRSALKTYLFSFYPP
jgi:hypothetical protein